MLRCHAERILARKFGLEGSNNIKCLIFLFNSSNLTQNKLEFSENINGQVNSSSPNVEEV